MRRPDAATEIVIRNNAAAALRPSAIILVKLEQEAIRRFSQYFPHKKTYQIDSVTDLEQQGLTPHRSKNDLLHWGRDRVGLGLLQALHARKEIEFSETSSPNVIVRSETDHLVVCEEDNELAQVIAANYAFAIGAGMQLIPRLVGNEADELLERFYTLYDGSEQSPSAILESLKSDIRLRSAGIDLVRYRSVTFVTSDIPWGFGYPEIPSTHLFLYPNLGISLLNGLLAEQAGSPGIRVALLVDPGQVASAEIDLAIKALGSRAVFVKNMQGKRATVRRVARAIELYPYDVLLVSTHCGDAPGWRWTYEFVDSERIPRRLVVDLAIGVATVPGDEKLEVTHYFKFVSLDGVEWNDPQKNNKLYVGTAISDWIKGRQGREFEPVKKESVARVPGSSALKMSDGNYLAIPRSLADEASPIVFNNACASWHRLAESFTFSNARAYLGTLFSVSDAEAQEIVGRLLHRHFGKPLALALWHAQNEVYGSAVRRPYVLVGIYSQRLRTTAVDAPMLIWARMRRSMQHWIKRRAETDPSDDSKLRTMNDYVSFLSSEIEALEKNWIAPRRLHRKRKQ